MKSDHEQPGQFRERRSARTTLSTSARLSGSGWYDVEVKICDVSRCGFKAECRAPVRIGSLVSLDVPGIGRVEAQVRWQIGSRMGGMFLDPISLTRCEWTAVASDPPGASA